MSRVGVFGGSFNPIHLGHLLLADEILERLALDQVLFVPAGRPPHKPAGDLAPASHRYAMTKLAIQGHPRFSVSDLEITRQGPSYTVDTLRALRQSAGPGDEFFLLVGSETFLDLLTWKDSLALAQLARLVVIPRVGTAFDPDGREARKILQEIGQERWVRVPAEGSLPALPLKGALLVSATSLSISASDLRRRAREGRSLSYRVPESVSAYMLEHRLYRTEG